jgi:hypothetical protein
MYFPYDNWVSGIFEENYPFGVWEENLRCLSQGGPMDVRVYSLTETLLFLVETYVTVLTGSLGNPAFRWMSIERFSPPQKIGRLVKLLRSSEGWERIQESEEFAKLRGVASSGESPSETQLYSLLLGNPASKLPSGETRTTYEPEILIETVQRLVKFRDVDQGLLNAIKHGFRLPKYSDMSLDLLVRQSAVDENGRAINPEKVREGVHTSVLIPAFWFLETDLRNKKQGQPFEGASAELRLYGVEPNRALGHCRLVLELLKLLFDSTRGLSRFGEAYSRLTPPHFSNVLEPLLCLWFPIQQPPDDEAYVVSAYVPQE